jgi:hypothetical protein
MNRLFFITYLYPLKITYFFFFFNGLTFLNPPGLPRVIQAKYRRMMEKRIGKTTNNLGAGTENINLFHQATKKRYLVGVLRDRYYPIQEGDPAALLEALKSLDNDSDYDFTRRESVFAAHRNAMQILFNQSAGDFLSRVPGFFRHPRHCESHCDHLTGRSLRSSVEEEFSLQLGLIRKVLNSWGLNEEAKQRLAEASAKSLEHQACQILRELSFVWHQNFGGFIRRFEEPAPPSAGPHLMCRETALSVSSSLSFYICVDGRLVLGNLRLLSAIAAFFHLILVGQLKYAAEGEAVALLLQRRVAKVVEKGKQQKWGCFDFFLNFGADYVPYVRYPLSYSTCYLFLD